VTGTRITNWSAHKLQNRHFRNLKLKKGHGFILQLHTIKMEGEGDKQIDERRRIETDR
jgi:hypothetical protein